MRNCINSRQHKLLRRLVWLFAPSCMPVFTSCYAGNGVSEQTYLQDFPVVLSASRLRQPISETPNAVTVIDRDMIKASGFRNIPDLFNLVPGMYVDYDSGHTPFVSYHGATDEYTRRMQILVDGRSIYMPPYNTVLWRDLPLHINDIERIEVVRGPAATSFGSNSIFGVINITTRDASAVEGTALSVTQGNTGGGNGASDIAMHLGKRGDQFDYRFTISKSTDKGLKFPTGFVNWRDGYDDSSDALFANLRANYRFSAVDEFDIQLGVSDTYRAIGDPRNKLRQPHDVRDVSGFQQVRWLRTLSGGDDIQLHYYHMSISSSSEVMSLPMINGSTILPSNPLYPLAVRYLVSNEYTTHRHEVELQHTLYTHVNNRLVWGMASRYESVAFPTMFDSPQGVHQYRLFVHDEWRIIPKLLLNAGTMLEDDGMGHRNSSPRLSVNYHLTPEHTFRAGVSVAYRNPALAEEKSNKTYQFGAPYQEWKSTGGLRPERALSREIGYIGDFKNGFSVDARAYNDQISDLIWLDNNLGNPASIKLTFGLPIVLDFRNEFAARYTGFEGAFKYKWGNRNILALDYAHQNVSCDQVGALYLASTPLASAAWNWFSGYLQTFPQTVPRNTIGLSYSGRISDTIEFSTRYFQQSAMLVITGDNPQPLKRRVDMRIAKQFKPSGKVGGGEISLVVQNLFQQKKGEPVGYSGYLFDRRAYVTATLNF